MDMDFTIEQRDEKTLKGRLKAYPFLRMELNEKFAGHKNLETALCHLTESALKDRIALLYHHYVNGSLSASGFPWKSPVDTGTAKEQRNSMYLIIRMLTELDMDLIGGNVRLMEDYHVITTIIEKYWKKGVPALRHREFWLAYFSLYEDYTRAKEEASGNG